MILQDEEILNILARNVLFNNLDKERISYLLSISNYHRKTFPKDSIIVYENDLCNNVGFVLSGSVNISKMNVDGSNMTIKTMTKGDFFGDALLFSSYRTCHSTIITASEATVLFISSEDILKICDLDEIFLRNFLAALSDKIGLLNQKIRILSFSSVRQRIVCFLLEEYKKQGSKNINLQITREELGELLAVTRPSISRELSKMEKDGLISVKGRKISILNLDEMALKNT